MNNSNTIIIRSPEVIAAEINTIKRTTAQYILLQSIEIGKLLVEAKNAVPHGEWGGWLEANFEYSTSTANNLMRIYTEYGEEEQISFFEENRLELFGQLNRSQAISLLQLPRDDRADFVRTHDMSAMSVRDLDDEIAKIKAENDKLIDKALSFEKAKIEAERERDENRIASEKALAESQSNLKKSQSKVKALQEENKTAEARIKDEIEKNKRLEEQLAMPVEITPEERQKIADEATSEKDREIETLRGKISQLTSSLDPTVQRFAVYFESMQDSFNKMIELIHNCGNIETADRLKNAIIKTINILKDTIESED